MICKISDKAKKAFDRFTISCYDDTINITVMAHTEDKVYAALYKGDGRLVNVQCITPSELPQLIALPVLYTSGAYMKFFNWEDDMKPITNTSETIEIEDLIVDNSYEILEGKTVYAFGDSIVYGHNAPTKSFMRLLSDDYGMELTMLAKNGATVITTDSYSKEDPDEETTDNYIINQIKSAPDEKPDVIVFDGYTNDAYGNKSTDSFNSSGSHVNVWENLGTIQGRTADSFDTSTFCGGFEKIIYEMRKKWGDTPIVFTTIHKSGGRNWDTQCKLRELSLEMCEKWDVAVTDIFNDTTLDTRNADQMSEYIINGAGSHPNESACCEFYIPIVVKKLSDVLTKAQCVIPDNVSDTVDIAIFAGQSNMSGRGVAAEAVVCDVNVGFEYKSVSDPFTLVRVTEPFGLDEDREGAIYDYNADGTTKRTGSMVSALIQEYYNATGRQIVGVSASIGGSSTIEWKSKYIFDAVKRLSNTEKFLKANCINIGRIFVVWCQGESDGDNGVSAETYTANTKDIFDTFKAYGATDCFLIQTGHYRDGGTTDEKYGIIRKAQETLCENNYDFVMVASLEPYWEDMKDKYHYNQATYNAVGKNAGKNIAEYYEEKLNVTII